MKLIIRYFKIIITILALLNLLFLFCFNYSFPKTEKEKADTAEAVVLTDDYTLTFDPDPLVLTDSRDADLTKGVTIRNKDGQLCEDAELYIRIRSSSGQDHKTITYTWDSPSGRVEGSRGLTLKNYSGPSVTLQETAYSLELNDPDRILSTLIDKGELFTDDGYGHTLNDAVEFRITGISGSSNTLDCSFTVTNLFNDSRTADARITMKSEIPVLILKDSACSLKTGDSFSPVDQIVTAFDTDGTSLTDRVQVDGLPDLTVPGIYTLTYSVTGLADPSLSARRTLTVTVKEN